MQHWLYVVKMWKCVPWLLRELAFEWKDILSLWILLEVAYSKTWHKNNDNNIFNIQLIGMTDTNNIVL